MTTAAQRIAVRAGREALAEVPEYRDNKEPLYWVGRLKAATELLLDAFAPAEPPAWETGRDRPVETLACGRCGATDTPLVPINDEGDLRCNESRRCHERVAARNAEAAQVQA